MPESEIAILVVDDDDAFRSRLGQAIVRRGFRVEDAPDIAMAQKKLIENPALSAAIVDLSLANENGLDLIRWLAHHSPKLQVLILTGYGSIATAVQAIQLGASDYLTKPADADQILQALFKNSEPFERVDRSESESASAGRRALSVPSLERVEWEHLQRVLADCGGNISAAARALGIERRTLQRKLAKFPPGQ